MKKLALIGDNAVLNIGLRHVISSGSETFSIVESEHMAGYYKSNDADDIDIIMLVIDSSDGHGDLDQIALAIKNSPNSSIIIYDNQIELEKVPIYLKSEVQGYISKKSELSEITKCLSTVQKGKKYLSKDAMEWVLNKFYYQQEAKNTKAHKKNNFNLTQHELTIAKYLTAGMKTSVIAKKIDRKLSTISTIKYNIFKKLNVDNVIDLKTIIESNTQQNKETADK
jgi:DNA-binding NarL/FixJ family response regulator